MDQEIKLRCYAHELEDRSWYAHCITLCLDATGSSFQEARGNLDDVIISYIQTVVEKGLDTQLIPRRSPLSMQATYWYLWLLCSLRKLSYQLDRFSQSSTFECSVPIDAIAHA